MQTFKHNEKWLIVIHSRTIGSDGPSNSASMRHKTETFDMCWSGERWVPQAGLGKQFDTQEEALQYLQENASTMEATRRSVPPVAEVKPAAIGK